MGALPMVAPRDSARGEVTKPSKGTHRVLAPRGGARGVDGPLALPGAAQELLKRTRPSTERGAL
jgi:hypothetical protein